MLTLPKYTFINGPPGSGKSTFASLLCKSDHTVWRESFAQPIRDMIYAVFYPDEGPISFSFDLRDAAVKKSFMPFSSNEKSHTIREAMISFSEDWMKPGFGPDIFGRLLHARCESQEIFYDRFVIDDSGFAEEAQHIVERVGPDSCLLLHLHRFNCDFTSDSRSYITLNGVRTIELSNNGPPTDMLDSLALELGNL